VQTNIVMCSLTEGAEACASLVRRLKEQEILVSQLTPETVRLVTHRHIRYNDVDRALAAFQSVLSRG
jgi:threonine aldolase